MTALRLSDFSTWRVKCSHGVSLLSEMRSCRLAFAHHQQRREVGGRKGAQSARSLPDDSARMLMPLRRRTLVFVRMHTQVRAHIRGGRGRE